MRKNLIFLLIITFLGFGIRFYKLTESPNGLYIDETSIGYNAYSLITTGKDEHGESWPLFFEAFGEWKLPVYIYAVVISQKLLGPTDFSIRLPAVLFGTGTIIAVYFLAKYLWEEKGEKKLKDLPVFAALFLALSPWHFQFTHVGFEASAGIFFLTIGLALFFYSRNLHKLALLVASFVSFVLTLYAYNSARIVTPALVLLLFVFSRKSFTKEQWIVTFLISFFLALPFMLFSTNSAGLARARQVSIFYQNPDNLSREFLTNYWKNISPVTLFVSGEPTIAHRTSHRMGLLHPVELPLVILGLIFLLRSRGSERWLLLFWLFLGFVPPAITTLNPHALRASFTIPVFSLMSGIGVTYAISLIRQPKIRFLLLGVLGVTLILVTGNFLTIYHMKYTRDAGWDWQVGIKRTASAIKNISSSSGQVYIEENAGAKVSYLWYLKIPPKLYLETEDKNVIGNYTFINQNNPSGLLRGSFYINSGKEIGHELIQTILYPNDTEAQKIWFIN